MFIYFANILLVIVWALIFCQGNILSMDDRVKRSNRTRLKRLIFLVLCFAQFFFIGVVRKSIGSDFYWYYDGFTEMRNAGTSSFTYLDWEIGFVLLNKFVGLFTSHAQLFIAVTMLLELAGPFYLILRYSRNEFISVFVYICMWFLYMDIDFIRQSIAMSIVCFGYPFLKDKKFWRYLIIVVMASLFHFSALYMIPVYFVMLLKANWNTFMIYLGGLIAYLVFSDIVVGFVFKRWHTEYNQSRFILKGVHWKYPIIPCVICIGFILLMPVFRNKSRSLQVSIHFAMLTFFWQFVMMKHSLFERFSYYSMLFLIISLPECLYLFKKRYKKYLRVQSKRESDVPFTSDGNNRNVIELKLNRVVVLILLGYMILLWFYNVLGLMNGVHGVVPYEVMLDSPLNGLLQLF